LKDFKIIVTRPREQLTPLLTTIHRNLQADGFDYEVLGLPLLEILPLEAPDLAHDFYQKLLATQWLNFVSPNAFLMADQLLKSKGMDWPKHLKILLVGEELKKFFYNLP
jgi:uroporphyrinogen-III synthase